MMRLTVTSRQAAFDKAYKALIAQGKPARDRLNHCRYKAVDAEGGDCMCAIGHLIDPATYKLEAEGWDVRSLTRPSPPRAKTFRKGRAKLLTTRLNTDFLRALQIAHDDADVRDFVNIFKMNMEEVAQTWRLKVPAIEEGAS